LSSLFGSGAGAPTWLSMTAYFITLISTTGFGAYSAKFGVIPASALAAVFTYAGWLPLTGGAAIFLIAMAVTAFIGYLQHGR
ncbi:MAG: hypothetical protein KGI89_17360, partial [Euryarchaeota archaeon]|nr:hypothetical protein [Euryarchaeota archaeon]